jgi:hypothetical protein
MDIESLRQLGNRLFAPKRGQRHFGFESGRVVPAGTSCHEMLLVEGLFAFSGAKSSLMRLSDFPGHL